MFHCGALLFCVVEKNVYQGSLYQEIFPAPWYYIRIIVPCLLWKIPGCTLKERLKQMEVLNHITKNQSANFGQDLVLVFLPYQKMKKVFYFNIFCLDICYVYEYLASLATKET